MLIHNSEDEQLITMLAFVVPRLSVEEPLIQKIERLENEVSVFAKAKFNLGYV